MHLHEIESFQIYLWVVLMAVATYLLTGCANGYTAGDEFFQLDKNHDRVLTREEAACAYDVYAFRRMDRNGNNRVTHAEFDRYDAFRRDDDPAASTDLFYNR